MLYQYEVRDPSWNLVGVFEQRSEAEEAIKRAAQRFAEKFVILDTTDRRDEG